MTRRALLRVAGTAALACVSPRAARGQNLHTVGLVLPPAGPEATALEQGAALGLDDANALATLFGKGVRILSEVARDGAAARAVGRALTRHGGASALIGGAGGEVANALGDVAASEAALFLNVAAPDDQLRNERCGPQSFHLIPSVTMYVDALAHWLIDRRRLARWLIVGDGSARGREIDAAARRALGRRGGSSATIDGAAEVVLLTGHGDALRQSVARARGDGSRMLAGIGGEFPEHATLDEAAGVWAVGWHHELDRFSARELNARFRRRFGAPFTETSWAAWAAVKLVGEAVVRGNAADAAGLRAFLEAAPRFDGHKGSALTFRAWDHQLRQPVYVIAPRRREDIAGRRGPFEVVADVPGSDLDAIGASRTESRCRLTP